jgi:type VI secretion system protein VasD
MRLRCFITYPLLGMGLLLASCSPPPPPPPPVVTLVVTAGADQNPDAAGKPSPVAVRVFQLNATAKFERADVFALIDREQQTLGADDAGSEEFVLAPSESRTLKIEPKPGVSAIGVTVLYRDIDHAHWRATAPIASSGSTKLAATIRASAVTLKPGP